jgi:hypothetical protein
MSNLPQTRIALARTSDILPRTLSSITYHLTARNILLERHELDRPDLACLDAFKLACSHDASRQTDTISGEFSGRFDRDVLFKNDLWGTNQLVMEKHPNLSPIRRAVLLVFRAALERSAPMRGTAQLPVSAVRDGSSWVHQRDSNPTSSAKGPRIWQTCEYRVESPASTTVRQAQLHHSPSS